MPRPSHVASSKFVVDFTVGAEEGQDEDRAPSERADQKKEEGNKKPGTSDVQQERVYPVVAQSRRRLQG